jgi:hypothetical protein
MTTLGKFLIASVAVGLVIAATLIMRPHPAPAVEHAALTPAQLAEIQQPKAEEPKPVKPAFVRPAPAEEDDAEDGNGS